MASQSNCRYFRCIVIYAMWCCTIACRTMYASSPANGFYCPSGNLRNISDIGQQQCTRYCLTDKACRVMSYNTKYRICLLGETPCVVATSHPDYMLMIFRSNLDIDPIIWKPKSNPLPARTVDTRVTRHEALCRTQDGDDLLIGHGEPHAASYTTLEDGSGATHYGGSVLTVHPAYTLAWVPYVAGSPLPKNAVPCGYLTTEGHTYCAQKWRPDIERMLFGYYRVVKQIAYYAYWGTKETTEMDILIRVWTTP